MRLGIDAFQGYSAFVNQCVPIFGGPVFLSIAGKRGGCGLGFLQHDIPTVCGRLIIVAQ